MQKEKLVKAIFEKNSYLCVGLDVDVAKLPPHLPKNKHGLLAFNRAIVEATAPYAVAYKINLAFYELLGKDGWDLLEKTLDLLPKNTFRIADAKRGDIGNTSKMYARTFFERLSFDALTVAPYMGRDSVLPFLAFPNKWVILLALTSNQGSNDFQRLPLGTTPEAAGEQLFERVLKVSQNWGTAENLMYVLGATHPREIRKLRNMMPAHFFLVPGIGAQGGSLVQVSEAGLSPECGLLVNASRSIIYASAGEDFAQAAANEAAKLQKEMKFFLEKIGKQKQKP